MTYNLGESIPVEITYRNNAGRRIVTENPAKSFDITMHLTDLGNDEDLNYTMGRMRVTIIDKASDRYVSAMPPPDTIILEPDSSVTFSSDLNDRLYLRPGNFLCFLTELERQSNQIKIEIKFTRESVLSLAKVAQNENQEYGRREWAMDWLAKLYPDFKLKLSAEEDSAEVRKQNETYNGNIIDSFMKWWDANRNSAKTDELLKQAEIEE